MADEEMGDCSDATVVVNFSVTGLPVTNDEVTELPITTDDFSLCRTQKSFNQKNTINDKQNNNTVYNKLYTGLQHCVQ